MFELAREQREENFEMAAADQQNQQPNVMMPPLIKPQLQQESQIAKLQNSSEMIHNSSQSSVFSHEQSAWPADANSIPVGSLAMGSIQDQSQDDDADGGQLMPAQSLMNFPYGRDKNSISMAVNVGLEP